MPGVRNWWRARLSTARAARDRVGNRVRVARNQVRGYAAPVVTRARGRAGRYANRARGVANRARGVAARARDYADDARWALGVNRARNRIVQARHWMASGWL